MIIIGEKLNGSIPSVAKAIAEKDADLIRERARMQAEAGATFLDVCASVEEAVEVETLKWMIDLVQEVTDTPICVDSPSARSCVAAIPFCKRPGLINSVSLEGDKIDTIFPVIADTDWECVALLCDNDGIPDSVERRMKIFFGIMEKAKQYGIAPSRLHIDPLVVTLGTDQTALTVFADCCRRIKYEYPEIHITSGLSNISFGLPVRKNINQAFMVLAMNAGMDSAIVDPTNKNMIGMIYATNALLERDEYCLQYIDKFGNKASEEAAQPAPASPLDEKMQKVFKLTQDGKNKEIGQAVQEALDAGCDPTAILNDAMIGAMAVVGDNFKKEIILYHRCWHSIAILARSDQKETRFYPTAYAHSGSVSMDKSVVNTTFRAANGASLPYLAAKMAAVAPAGMPVIRTLTPSAVGSRCSSSPTPSAAAGSSASRSKLNFTVSRLTMLLSGASVRIVPTINIVSAELQFPMYFTVFRITDGSCTCVTMQRSPK